MGESTKAIIEITNPKNKEVFAVRNVINNVLKRIEGKIRPYNNPTKTKRWSAAVNAEFKLDDGFFTVNFNNKNERRMMFVFLNCDSDYKNLAERSIILSLGTYDNGAELIRKFAEAFKGYDGKIYFTESDLISDEFEII